MCMFRDIKRASNTIPSFEESKESHRPEIQYLHLTIIITSLLFLLAESWSLVEVIGEDI